MNLIKDFLKNYLKFQKKEELDGIALLEGNSLPMLHMRRNTLFSSILGKSEFYFLNQVDFIFKC